MSDDLTISPLALDDLPAVAQLFTAHTGRPADLELLATWIAEAPGAAARRGDELVGYVVAKRFAPDLVELASVLVAPSARDGGVGTRMVREVEQRWSSQGGRGAVAVASTAYEVVGAKRSSVPFWERAGYRRVFETAATTVVARTLDEAGS